MMDYFLIDPSLENCTLVKYIFESFELLSIEVCNYIVDNSNYQVLFWHSGTYISFSSNDNFNTVDLKVLDGENKLLDAVSLDEFDDAISISGFLCKHFTGSSYNEIGDTSTIDVIDEETEVQSTSWRTKGVVPIEEPSSIVPDIIYDCRVVALVYNNSTIAYRFKTNAGSFDMSRSVASRYGLSPDKVTKFTCLMLVNNIFMTKGEHDAGRLIPDVSNSKVDCDKLFSALFEVNY